MKSRILFVALCCAIISQAQTQENIVDRFLHNQSLQDSIIEAILPSHALMSKLIGKIAENPQLHEMVIQHLLRLQRDKPGSGGEHDHASHASRSQYAGEEKREIKALSASETEALTSGEGMGMAMAAELNHYPGPRHVLDLGDQLALSEAQRKSARASFDQMHADALRFGGQLITKERALDKAFASQSITLKLLDQLIREIEELRGRLRYTHLAAHVKVHEILTSQQITSYDLLRGYTAAE